MAPPTTELTVFVIDADPQHGDETALLLGRAGIRFQRFSDADALLAGAGPELAGCVVAPWAADGDLIRRLRQRGALLPVCVAGRPPTPDAVRQAFREGALDFLFDPVSPEALLGAVREAFASERKRITSRRRARQRDQLFDALTRREREVAELAAQGHDNQRIGHRLGISHRTVEVHKSRLMRKLGARSLADLIRLGEPPK